ncbi:helix-turn-helix transcriptional regulator [Vallitalea okinawensis]|uniref:helix-turn-helix transcriptional regulator n=1 Tax=Vallitalea okinawensis TaxID=2078660 RepID=UPI000CFB602B|nr:helix-turn-helix transcriptional regulator [Vallitalea okinawensis]
MELINFACPPLPHFVVAGSANYGEKNVHPTRKNVGVFDLIFVVSGRLYIAEEDTKYILEENQFIILSPDTRHIGYKHSPTSTKFHWLHFQSHGEYIESDKEVMIQPLELAIHVNSFRPESPFNIAIPKTGELVPLVAKEIESYLKSLATIHVDLENERISIQELDISTMRQQTIFMNILDTLSYSTQDCQPDIPTLVTNYIKSNFSKAFTLKDMAKELNFHPNYITRVMKQKMSITPMEFLMTYRINYSKYLMSHGNFPIKKIAKDSGFQSPAYFSKIFKARTGMLPSEYYAKIHQ